MRKVLVLSDFYPAEFIKNDPEMQGILHGTLGEEFHIDYMNDSMFKNSDNPMSIIRDFEKSGHRQRGAR